MYLQTSGEDINGPEPTPRGDLVFGVEPPDAAVEAVRLVPFLPVVFPAHRGLPPPRPRRVVLELQHDRI